LVGKRKPYPLIQSKAHEEHAHFSPDGRWISYDSDESGRFEVYVQPFPLTGAKWQVSIDGGADSQWSRDGKKLYFFSLDRKLMTTDITGIGKFEGSRPQPLFQTQAVFSQTGSALALFPDDKRFLIQSRTEESRSPITVLWNWQASK